MKSANGVIINMAMKIIISINNENEIMAWLAAKWRNNQLA